MTASAAAHRADANPEEHHGSLIVTPSELRRRRQPPLRSLLDEIERAPHGVSDLVGRIHLLECAGHDDAAPAKAILDLVQFEAYLRILAHPLDLPTDGRNTIQRGGPIKVKRDRHDVWLTVTGAREPADTRLRQQLETFRLGQFMDGHPPRVYSRIQSWGDSLRNRQGRITTGRLAARFPLLRPGNACVSRKMNTGHGIVRYTRSGDASHQHVCNRGAARRHLPSSTIGSACTVGSAPPTGGLPSLMIVVGRHREGWPWGVLPAACEICRRGVHGESDVAATFPSKFA